MTWLSKQWDCDIDAWGYSNDWSDSDIEIARTQAIDVRLRQRIARAKRKKMLTLKGKKDD